MKIGLFSDIHCNLPGLQRALGLLRDCDEILCAGDIMYQYRFSNDVLALLREHRVHAIVGNHDKTILYAPGHPLRDDGKIEPEQLGYLAALPGELTLTLGPVRIAMFHGSPWDEAATPVAHYIYPQDRHSMRQLDAVEADVVVLGHTHIPFTERVGTTLVVNPGSCGECRDGTDTLTCAVLDTSTLNVDLLRFTLDDR